MHSQPHHGHHIHKHGFASPTQRLVPQGIQALPRNSSQGQIKYNAHHQLPSSNTIRVPPQPQQPQYPQIQHVIPPSLPLQQTPPRLIPQDQVYVAQPTQTDPKLDQLHQNLKRENQELQEKYQSVSYELDKAKKKLNELQQQNGIGRYGYDDS